MPRLTMKQARIGINATQEDIAKRMGMHPQTYSKLEKHPESVTIEQGKRFCEIVGVCFEDIFFGIDSN